MSIEYLREYGDLMEPGDYDGTAMPGPPPPPTRDERQRDRDRWKLFKNTVCRNHCREELQEDASTMGLNALDGTKDDALWESGDSGRGDDSQSDFSTSDSD
ncbi:hypothetical protein HPB52_007548 [Rhipicephalus sanguineus]|uniref:Uncharacterized protein n=1 Tax=Rhipicephalus sanguineus TaxID=34632 RepID=A0A9D4T786_RHISA|nr:hypothetical protein HPB52_007548 [Rhipicephalus sanguineus]